MNVSDAHIYLSAIDEQRFGIHTARISNMTSSIFPAVMDFCHSNKVILLIARCLTTELETAQAMERQGFLLMDTLVYYSRKIPAEPMPSYSTRIRVRPFMDGEEQNIAGIASECFRGYTGHYHADSRLDSARCDEVYVSWALNECASRGKSREVLVADVNNILAGFLTIRVVSPDECEVGLFCVKPSFRGTDVAQSLMIYGMEWSYELGAKKILTSTQITNTASQKVWIRQGFEPNHSYYTFHKWFDDI